MLNIPGPNCAIIAWDAFQKHKLAPFHTELEGQKLVDYKTHVFYFAWLWEEIFKYYRDS